MSLWFSFACLLACLLEGFYGFVLGFLVGFFFWFCLLGSQFPNQRLNPGHSSEYWPLDYQETHYVLNVRFTCYNLCPKSIYTYLVLIKSSNSLTLLNILFTFNSGTTTSVLTARFVNSQDPKDGYPYQYNTIALRSYSIITLCVFPTRDPSLLVALTVFKCFVKD